MISEEISNSSTNVASPNVVDTMQRITALANRRNLSTLEDFVLVISQTMSSTAPAVQYPLGTDRGIPNDARIQYAMYYVEQGLQRFPDSYDLKYFGHKIAVRQGNMSRATEFFMALRGQYNDHEPFKEYLAQIAHSVINTYADENFSFFIELPSDIREDILLRSAIFYESKEKFLEACNLFNVVLKVNQNTESVFYLGIHAAELTIRCEDRQALPVDNPYRMLLATQFLPFILRRKITVYDNDSLSTRITPTTSVPNVRIAARHSKSNSASIQTGKTHGSKKRTDNRVQFKQLISWLYRTQSYYLALREWRTLFEVSLEVLSKCGYLKLESSAAIRVVDLFDQPLDFAEKLFDLIARGKFADKRQSTIALSIGIACFIYHCFEYYERVFGEKSRSGDGNSTCLIPVTRNESNRSILTPSMQYLASYNTSKQKLDPAIANTFPRVKNNTVRRNGSHSERTKKRKVCQSDRCERYDVMKVTNLLISEDASQQTDCMCDNSDDDSASEAEVANNQEVNDAIVGEAILYLERAGDCWIRLKKMINNANCDVEQEITRLIEIWKLPLDLSNALSFTSGEIALAEMEIEEAHTVC
ncbi:5315_t:CDS:10 [Paraglomus brasilianum]|uniref:5315_t:CDS:1 n=1 Tax=Paraglomus brasilianum TaxID=144538 RepID=A0A9N9CTB1_9GLOM|nr:5315_t:CDS:10 [Paraglomus brasilianum]